MSEAQSIEFRKDGDKVLVVSAWPAVALMSAAVLTGDAPFIRVVGDSVMLVVENGVASYKARDVASDPLVLDLLTDPPSTFEDPDAYTARIAAELEAAKQPKTGTDKPDTGTADGPKGEYLGPNIGEIVIHNGARKTVMGTRYVDADQSSHATFDGVEFFNVEAMQPAE